MENDIIESLKYFVGNIKQVPPRYSALKIKGKRAYKLARQIEIFSIPPRDVKVLDLKL